jgi:hypothetical protein
MIPYFSNFLQFERARNGSSMRPMLLSTILTRNDANRLRRPSIEARRVLNEVANCFLEVQNANTVFNAWGMKLIVGQSIEISRQTLNIYKGMN